MILESEHPLLERSGWLRGDDQLSLRISNDFVMDLGYFQQIHKKGERKT